MRQTLILRALKLPLIAALCICGALVGIAPYTQFASEPSHVHPATADSLTVNINILTSEAAQTADSVHADSRAAEMTRIEPEFLDGNCPVGNPCETSTLDSTGTPTQETPQTPVVVDVLVSCLCARIDTALETAHVIVNRTMQTAKRRFTVWPIPALEDPSEALLRASSDNSLIDSNDPVIADAGFDRVRIRNASNASYSVSFLVDGTHVQLAPGHASSSKIGSISIHFDRGGSHGSVRQVLAPGHYEFRLTSEGWELNAVPASQ